MKDNRIFIKCLSLITIISLLASVLLVSFTVSAESNYWDGNAAQSFKQGNGTASSPYLISSPAELLLAVSSTGIDSEGNRLYYELKNNIYVNPALSSDWLQNNPVPWTVVTLRDDAKAKAFKGNFDGNGYTVYGLYVKSIYTAPSGISADRSVATGLFPVLGEGAVVNNVGIDFSYLSLTNNHSIADLAFAGQVGLVGYAYNSSADPILIDSCFIGNNMTMKAVFAGLIGDVETNQSNSVCITNCYAIPNDVSTFNEPDKVYIYNNRFMLGAGRDNSAAYKMDYCYTFGNLTFTGAGNSETKYNYCTEWTSAALGKGFVSKSSMQGSSAFENMVGLNSLNTYVVNDGYPTLKVFDKSPSNVWDGTEATPTALDNNGNLIIGTAEELAFVIKNGGGFSYILSDDIYLNDISAINWSTGEPTYGYTPREWFTSAEVTAFNGTIDGNGHIVYGLYYNKGTPAAAGSSNYSNDAVALFPRFSNKATVKNIGVDYSFIKAKNCAAGIVGSASGSSVRTIENCFVGERVYIYSHVAGGIIAGGDGTLNINNCYSLATLNATHQSGGILGGMWSYTYSGVSTVQKLNNCYSTTPLFGNGGGVRTNCFANIGTNCKGQNAIINFPLGEPYCATDSYPTLRIFKNLDEKNWNGLGISSFDGEGTENSPYLVENAGQLAYVVFSSASGHYKMTKDIYINDVSVENWQNNENLISWIWEDTYVDLSYEASRRCFKGTFDGNGYVVHGLWYSTEVKTANAALFPSADGATIKNLGVKNSYIRGGYTKDFVIDNGYSNAANAANNASGTVAAILGYVLKTAPTTVSNCFADESVYLTNYSNGNLCATAGIVGYVFGNKNAELTVTDCFSSAKLFSNSTSKLNGIIGSCWTGYYIAKNNYSIGYKPFMIGTNVTSMSSDAYSGNYSDTGTSCNEYNVLSHSNISGEKALENLIGFSDELWYSVKNSDSSPLHRIYGTAIGDVDENGAGKSGKDIIALRKTLIGEAAYKNTDYNRDGKTNICDLVKMSITFKPVVTFNANGGTFAGNKTTINKEQNIGAALFVELPTYSGYGCIGWSTTPDGEILDSNIVTSDMDGMTLYAVWGEVLTIDAAFTDNMVLQRDKSICVWGTGKGTGEITIGNQTKTVVSENDSWEVYFEPMSASTTPVTFETNFAGIKTEYNNVLIGDVYLTSGQSNMEFTLKSSEQSGTVSSNSLLRFRNRGTNTWKEFTATNVEEVTAIGVLFANELSKLLNNNIPIGIISTAVGASRIDDWTHSDYCYCDEYEFDTLAHSDYSYYDQGHHSLYAKHIQPIEKMTTAGVLWYQGESNRGIGEAYHYLDMFKTMVNCWRTRMNDSTLPFYTVQIMLYTGDNGTDRNGKAVDEYNIRIAQGEAARIMDGVTVCTMLSREDTKKADGGWDIHPTDKLPIAKALVNAALSTYYYPLGDYNKTPEYSGPLYRDITVDSSTATVSFDHIAEGLMLTAGNTVTELEVCDENGNWVAATGIISGNSIIVSANGIDSIEGVRMGYRNSPDINLYNKIGGRYGYCASPFVWYAD